METKTKARNKNLNKILAGLVVIIAVGLIVGCIEKPSPPPGEEITHAGTVLFTITDAALDMGNVSSIIITIDEVSVRKIGENWTTVSNETKTYDLLKLKEQGTQELITQTKLDAGIYDEMRLHIQNVSVIVSGEEKEAKIPSNVLKIKGILEVKENTTSSVTFDFIADQSLHITGEGTVIMAPVVKLITMTDAEVDIKEEKGRTIVEIKKGKLRENKTVGMDENGTVGIGIRIKRDVSLTLETDTIKIGPLVSEEAKNKSKGRVVITITDSKMDVSNVSRIDITIDEVAIHKTAGGKWITLSDAEQTFNLMELQTTEELLANSTVDAGMYTEIRLNIKKATMTINNTVNNVTIPPSKLMLKGIFEVKENETSYAKIDFEANKSFAITGEGRIIMIPVIKLYTRVGANVSVKDDDTVELDKKGNLSDEVEIELDEKGNESKRNRTERGCNASCKGTCDVICRENCGVKAEDLNTACMSSSREGCKTQCEGLGIITEICENICEKDQAGSCKKEFIKICGDSCKSQRDSCISECEVSC